jgi:peptidoglycan/xylan/chitin deacetylase (PgdA/CDA1 family)
MQLLRRRDALLLGLGAPLFAQSRPKVAITIDDVNWKLIPEPRRNQAFDRLLTHVEKTQAFLFAVGQNIDSATGVKILEAWASAGHSIGNHTFSHKPLIGATIRTDDFEKDVLRNDDILRNRPGFKKWFRFPALKEGRTREERDRLRQFLAGHGYRNGAVTIDASDWYYSQRMMARLEAAPAFDPNAYRAPYLAHIWSRASFYDQLARDILKRSVTHTLLLHYNFLNALFLGDLMSMFRSKGWEIVGADEAFSDPVFRREPDTVPAGESLIWALAKETGKFDARLRYPGEDDVYEKPILDRLGL